MMTITNIIIIIQIKNALLFYPTEEVKEAQYDNTWCCSWLLGLPQLILPRVNSKVVKGSLQVAYSGNGAMMIYYDGGGDKLCL